MNKLLGVAGSTRERLFGFGIRRQTRQLEPNIRSALATDMTQELTETAVSSQLDEVEADILQAEETLAASEKKEHFLGVRSRQYRKALDERARQLKQEQERLVERKNATDEEGALQQEELDFAAKLEAWERDEDALNGVIQTHIQILGNCEEIRWKIKELKAKKKETLLLSNQCKEFLDAAASADNETEGDRAEEPSGETELSELSLNKTARSSSVEQQTTDNLAAPQDDRKLPSGTEQPNKMSAE